MTSKAARTELKIAVILTDAERHIIWVNDDFTHITGYGLEEVLGQKPSILQGPDTDPEDILRIRQKLGERVSFKDQILNYRKNGEPYLCKLTIHPVFDQNERLVNYIAFEIDGDVVRDDSHISLLHIKNKYATSSLTNFQNIDIWVRLVAMFEIEKMFLNPNLKLKDIADKLKTNTRYLSQVVNQQTGDNILAFINAYRIEEAKRRIVEDGLDHLTTFGVAQLCGFKNKSTFYKVFREIVGMTPKDYIIHEKGYEFARARQF